MHDIDRILRKIASNLWFEWNAEVHELFRKISPYVWGLFRRNIYRFLRIQSENPALYHHRLAEVLTEEEFLTKIQEVEKNFINYMHPKDTIVSKNYAPLHARTVAYFSMEYGIDVLRIYSGGLGILSGDHLRGASDVGLSMVGVGLFYLQGYFEQTIGLDGMMNVKYDSIVPSNKKVRDVLPLEPVKRAGTHEDLILEIKMSSRVVKAKVWRARIGRSELLLLDSNVKENEVHDRHLTRRLYASEKQYENERRRRLEQEILLGIGGVMALEQAGYKPAVYHLNEGHVALAILEILRLSMQKQNLSFEDARNRCSVGIGFTTHTPVPEGNERFDERMAREYLEPYLNSFLNQSERETVFNCARNREDQFDMTKLSLMMAQGYRNGVSALHGEVCRKMWGFAWGNDDPDGKGVPIGHITNAVHRPYWQKPLLYKLIESSGGIENVSSIEDDKIWELHLFFKRKLIAKVRERVAYQLLREKREMGEIHHKTKQLLSDDSFIIGFARRFATYKRVTMLLEDEEKLFQFMENVYRKYHKPVAVLYAGKPHPNNYSGYEKIQQVVQISERLRFRAEDRGFKADIIFIEGYDIDLARYLEAGSDIWLNNPIRPLEASGTSGMKAGMNGVLNVSISDGWVPESIQNDFNGWTFGHGEAARTDFDRLELFNLLEQNIIPKFFEKSAKTKESGHFYSKVWVQMMKNSIYSITKQFNTDRMLIDYIEKMYLPALQTGAFKY